MVNWSDSWLEKVDFNNVKVRLWVEKKNGCIGYAHCRLCNADLKFASQGFQAILQHSKKPKHKTVSDLRYGNNVRRFTTETSNVITATKNKTVTFDASVKDKGSAAEAIWLFKVAESDFSLRDCDQTPALFQKMFPDSEICKLFSMSREKASYVLQDGFGPLLGKKL